MENSLRILSWIGIVLGGLAILGALGDWGEGIDDWQYTIMGGLLFFMQGLVAILYIREVNK
jgi:hypothetical protein